MPVPDDAWVLLCAARLEPVKGIAYLLSAIAQLPVAIAGRPLHVVILGDGPLRNTLVKQAQQMGIAARLHWAGWVNDPAPYYQRADLVVFPSQPQETLGNVILEAWAYGVPLLTTASRGAVELCRHGVDTWRVPCADPKSLGLAIQQLLQEQTLRLDLAAAGSQRVRRDFSKRTIVGQYQELYARLAGH